MKPQIKITIQSPCSEKWNSMLPQEQGRHCVQCNRIILDFSTKSDQEILDYIQQASGKICGKFLNDQLDRTLIPIPQRKQIPVWQKIAASLFLLMGVERTYANHRAPLAAKVVESKTDTEKFVQRNIPLVNSKKNAKEEVVLKGMVLDSNTNEGVIFATVRLLGTDAYCNTDINGSYSFKLPIGFLGPWIELEYACVGYKKKVELILLTKDRVQQQIPLFIKLTPIDTPKIEVDWTTTGYVVSSEYVTPAKKWYQFWKK